jgi:hypothetical protein
VHPVEVATTCRARARGSRRGVHGPCSVWNKKAQRACGGISSSAAPASTVGYALQVGGLNCELTLPLCSHHQQHPLIGTGTRTGTGSKEAWMLEATRIPGLGPEPAAKNHGCWKRRGYRYSDRNLQQRTMDAGSDADTGTRTGTGSKEACMLEATRIPVLGPARAAKKRVCWKRRGYQYSDWYGQQRSVYAGSDADTGTRTGTGSRPARSAPSSRDMHRRRKRFTGLRCIW